MKTIYTSMPLEDDERYCRIRKEYLDEQRRQASSSFFGRVRVFFLGNPWGLSDEEQKLERLEAKQEGRAEPIRISLPKRLSLVVYIMSLLGTLLSAIAFYICLRDIDLDNWFTCILNFWLYNIVIYVTHFTLLFTMNVFAFMYSRYRVKLSGRTREKIGNLTFLILFQPFYLLWYIFEEFSRSNKMGTSRFRYFHRLNQVF